MARHSRNGRRRGDPAWSPFEEITPLFELNQGEHWSTTPWKAWENSRYTVVSYLMPPAPQRGGLPCIQLSIQRRDKTPIVNWRDLQRIKDEILGTMAEAVQLFPTKTRIIDTTNQYHLWALPGEHCFPVGYTDGRMTDQDPETQAQIREAHEAAKGLPGYTGGSKQPRREPHHTDEGLPDLGLAGEWWA